MQFIVTLRVRKGERTKVVTIASSGVEQAKARIAHLYHVESNDVTFLHAHKEDQ